MSLPVPAHYNRWLLWKSSEYSVANQPTQSHRHFCPFQKHRDCAPPSPLNKQKSEKYLTEKDNRNGGYPPPPLPANPAWLRVPFPVTLVQIVVVLNCQKCNQCLTCHMSVSRIALWTCSLNVFIFVFVFLFFFVFVFVLLVRLCLLITIYNVSKVTNT